MRKLIHSGRNEYEKSWINRLSIQARRKMHPVLLGLITINRILSGFRIIVMNSHSITKDRPIIFAVTHILKEDIEISAEVIKMPFYLLTDDFERTHGTLGGCFIELNGVVYVDKSDKADMAKSKETCINLLRNGANIMWFPEGVWNLSPNLPVLPLPFGIIEAAIRANAIIFPLAIEQYGRKFIVNMGQELDFCNFGNELENDKDFKIMAINELRDVFATLKWEIWESQPMARRIEIAPRFWDRQVEEILNHWQHYDLVEVQACVYKPKGVISADEVFGYIE